MKKNNTKKKAIRTLAEMKYDYWMAGELAINFEMYPYFVGAAIGLGMDVRDLKDAVDKEFNTILKNKRNEI